MDGPGDDQVIIAKARAAGPPSEQARRLLDPSPAPAKESWRDAARAVVIKPHSAQPKIRDLERSVLPTLRTLRAQFVCDLCPLCGRPVIRSVLPDHVSKCQKRDVDDTVANGAAHSATNGHLNGANGTKLKTEDDAPELEARNKKKRKAEPGDEPGPKKAKAPKAPKATAKAKPPAKSKQARQLKQPKEKTQPVFNPDKNCGVILPTGQPCMRSLTCKAHSMAQKRAVVGRSAPYDVMLSNYQRQHQARQHQQLSAIQVAQDESDQQLEAQAQQNPEREVQQVMEGMSRVFCPPLDRKVIVHSQSRCKNFRLREMLALALLPRRLAPTGDALFGRSLAFRPEAPDALSPVRAPAVQQAIYLAQAQQMKMQHLRQQEQGVQAAQASSSHPAAQAQAQAQLAQQNQSPQARAADNQRQAQAHARFSQHSDQGEGS